MLMPSIFGENLFDGKEAVRKKSTESPEDRY